MSDRTAERCAHILRGDFAAFAERAFLELYPSRKYESNWHIEVVAAKLEAVRRGEIKRLIVNLPPGSMKSFLGSIAFPAFVLGHAPSAEILCTSYVQSIANDLAAPSRSLMLSPFYQALFGTRLADDQQSLESFVTTEGGTRKSVSLGGAITGRGADLIVIDDALRAEDAGSESARNRANNLYQSTLSSRLRRDTGAIVILMQRLHANDLTGFILRHEENWDVLAIPAISPQDRTYRIRTPYGSKTFDIPKGQALQPKLQGLEYLETLRKRQGDRAFDAQFQQKPHGAEGAVIKREWLIPFDVNSAPSSFDTVLQSWDTTLVGGENNSYNACTTWGVLGGQYCLLDAYHDQEGFGFLKNKALNLARTHNPTTILIEAQALGVPLAEELEQAGLKVQRVPVGTASKIERLAAHINKFQSGRILIPREGEFIEDYIEELTTFPDSRFNDWVDSTSQALAHDWSYANRDYSTIFDEPPARGSRKSRTPGTVRFKVLDYPGVIQFWDGSRPNITSHPPPGEPWDVDEELAIVLSLMPKYFERVPD